MHLASILSVLSCAFSVIFDFFVALTFVKKNLVKTFFTALSKNLKCKKLHPLPYAFILIYVMAAAWLDTFLTVVTCVRFSHHSPGTRFNTDNTQSDRVHTRATSGAEYWTCVESVTCSRQLTLSCAVKRAGHAVCSWRACPASRRARPRVPSSL